MKKIQCAIDDSEIKELTIKLCELGKEMGIEKYRFSIMLNIAVNILNQSQGLEINFIKKIEGSLN